MDSQVCSQGNVKLCHSESVPRIVLSEREAKGRFGAIHLQVPGDWRNTLRVSASRGWTDTSQVDDLDPW